MKLSRLLEALGRRVTEPAHGTGESDVRGLCYDSRRAEKGDLFIALKGLKATGSDFAADAIGGGARRRRAPSPCRGWWWKTPERRWRCSRTSSTSIQAR